MMARNLTIFGPNRSQRRNLFFEKNSNERRRHRGIVVVVIVAVVGGFWVACIKGRRYSYDLALAVLANASGCLTHLHSWSGTRIQ